MKTDGDSAPRNIVLTGFMGTGKTSVGHALAAHLGWPFVDTDALIEAQAGRAIADIINRDGEEYFRRMERAACQRVATYQQHVIATGGGAFLDRENHAALSSGNLVVCLTCEPDEILRRLNGDRTRPLLAGDPAARVRSLLAERQPLYDGLPNHIDTTRRTPDEAAQEVLALWQQA